MSRIYKALRRIEMKAIDRPRAEPISPEELEVFGLRRLGPPNEASLASCQPVAVVYHPFADPTIDEIVEPINRESAMEPTTGAERDATDDPLARVISIQAARSEIAAATMEAQAKQPVQFHPPPETIAMPPTETISNLSAEADTERPARTTLESSRENLAESVQDESNPEPDGTRLGEEDLGDDKKVDQNDADDVGSWPGQLDSLLTQTDAIQESVVVDWLTAVGSTEVEAVYTTETFENVLAVERFPLADWAQADVQGDSRPQSDLSETSAPMEPTNQPVVKPAEPLAGEVDDSARGSAIERNRREDASSAAVGLLEPSDSTVESTVSVHGIREGEAPAEPWTPPSRSDSPAQLPLKTRLSVGYSAQQELRPPVSRERIQSKVEPKVGSTIDSAARPAIGPCPPEPQERDALKRNSDSDVGVPLPVKRSEAAEKQRPESLERATVEPEPHQPKPERAPEPKTSLQGETRPESTTGGRNTPSERDTTVVRLKKTASAEENSALHPSPSESDADLSSVAPILSVQQPGVDETNPHLKSLAENILYQMPARSAVVMFTSSADGEGTSDTLGQVATALAPRLGGEILVVDCNFHNPRAAQFFDLQPEQSLVHVLAGETPWAQAVKKTRVEHLSVLAGGKFPTTDGLPSHRADLAMLVTELRHHYRLVLLDTASLSHGEVVSLSRFCDATYLVIRLGETSRQTAQQAARLLQNAGAKLRGCVLSNLPVE